MAGADIPEATHPLSFLRRGVQRVVDVNRGALTEGEFDFESSRELSRRGFLKATGVLFTAAVLESLFKTVEANDKAPGEHNFTPGNIAQLGISSPKELVSFAERHGYLPTETQSSNYSYSKFLNVAERASFNDLRQYFRAIEVLRNDGYFSPGSEKQNMHEIVSRTPEILPVKRLLFTALGARNEEQVIHGITESQLLAVLRNDLPKNYEFPYANDMIGKRMLKSFEKGLSELMNRSLEERKVLSDFDMLYANR